MALNIITINPETKELIVDDKSLEALLLDDAVKDLPITVICVAGASTSLHIFLGHFQECFGKGKVSFSISSWTTSACQRWFDK